MNGPTLSGGKKPHVMTLQEDLIALEVAVRDIEMARARIARQKTIVQQLHESGGNVQTARELAAIMMQTLAAMEAHRELILDHIEQLKRKKT
jgi:hypothetical protein